ncbi:MAG: hypothetical protein CMF41_03750 [Legionellales bacterium]|nr:hypothetical protein [Legionellales bacterium]
MRAFEEISLTEHRPIEFNLNQTQIKNRLNQLWEGEPINFSENKRALFILQRNLNNPSFPDKSDVAFLNTQEELMLDWLKEFDHTGYQHMICVGVGGSTLGLQFLDQALHLSSMSSKRLSFIDHLNSDFIDDVLKVSSPKDTIVLYISKSGQTSEVLWVRKYIQENAPLLKERMITAVPSIANSMGFQDVLPLHSEINGRMSIWSIVILPIAFKYGIDVIRKFRSGGQLVDQMMMETSLNDTISAQLASLSLQEQQKQHIGLQLFLNYDKRLQLFGHYLQQLEMESLGKPFNRSGQFLKQFPGQFILTEFGTQAQHSIMQYIHQCHFPISVTFLTTQMSSPGALEVSRHIDAQINVLNKGYHSEQIHSDYPDSTEINCKMRQVPGNKPTRLLTLKDQSIETLGALIAVYEYKVLIEAFHWDINPFDQFGVERPKSLLTNG